jgi:hypothetical protein
LLAKASSNLTDRLGSGLNLVMNMVMSPVEVGTKNQCGDDDLHEFGSE